MWLASILACLGEAREAQTEITEALTQQRENAYLNYRAAGAFAELGDIASALKHLRLAIDGGFRSIQLLEFEQRLTLHPLRQHPQFLRLCTTPQEHVNALHDHYAPLVDSITTTKETAR